MSILARYARPLPAQRPANALPVPLVSSRQSAFSTSFPGQHGRPGEDRTTPLERLGAVGTLYAVCDRICTAVSSIEWDLYQRPADGRATAGDERQTVAKHPALDLWRRPNPFMTTPELVYQLVQYRKLVGEWLLIIVRVPGTTVPLEVWPVRPDRMTPVVDNSKYLLGWKYRTPDGEYIPLDAADVIQSKIPNPLDPYRGLGAVQTILTELEASKYTAEWNRNFFLNSAEPGGVIQFPVNLSDSQYNEFVGRWRAQHQGVNNAHRIAVIEYGGEYVPRGYSQKDMEFTALREASRDQVYEAFGISRATMGVTDGVNFAAAKAADYQMDKHLTLPELRSLQQALNFRILPQFYPGKLPNDVPVEFDFDFEPESDPKEEALDRTSRVGAVTALWALPGVKFDLDALMSAYDLPEVPWEEAAVPLPGQMFDENGNVVPQPPPDPSAPDGGEGAGAGSAPKRGDSSGADGPPEKGKGGQQPAKPAPKPAKGAPPKSDVSRGTVRAADDPDVPAWDGSEHDAAWRAALDGLLARWSSVSAAQRAELGRQIASAIDDGDLAQLADLSVDSTDAARLLHEALLAVSRTAAHQAAAEASAQGVSVAPAAANTVELQAVADTVTGLLGTGLAVAAGREALRRADGQKTGAQVAGEVASVLEQASDAPVRDALGASLHGTMNTARTQTWRDGPVGSLYATEVLDAHTCAPCAAHDGRFVCTTEDLAPYDRLYTAIGGYVDCLGGIRCRGTVTGVWRPQTTGQP